MKPKVPKVKANFSSLDEMRNKTPAHVSEYTAKRKIPANSNI